VPPPDRQSGRLAGSSPSRWATDQKLGTALGVTHALAEEIGIAAEVLGRRQRDRIDPVLDRELAGGWEPRDPMSQRFDEGIERGGGH
jgi:hypothetical protein